MTGQRVLMIDLDPQASLTICCGMQPEAEEFEVEIKKDNNSKSNHETENN